VNFSTRDTKFTKKIFDIFWTSKCMLCSILKLFNKMKGSGLSQVDVLKRQSDDGRNVHWDTRFM